MIWQTVKAFLTNHSKSLSAQTVPRCSEEVGVWVETVGQGCCRRLMAAECVLSRQQSALCIPAQFASGLSSLAGSWVLYENRNEFTEESGESSPPTLCSCVGTLLTTLSLSLSFYPKKQSRSTPILSPFDIFPVLNIFVSIVLLWHSSVSTVQSGQTESEHFVIKFSSTLALCLSKSLKENS